MNLKKEHYSYIMMLGHLCADMSLFALSAAMPFLVVQKGMTMTATAGLGFIMSVCQAITQPLLGAMADKKKSPVADGSRCIDVRTWHWFNRFL